MLKRAITGLGFVAVFSACLYAGFWYWLGLLAVLYATCLSEFFGAHKEINKGVSINIIALALAWFIIAIGGHYYFLKLWEDKVQLNFPVGYLLFFLGAIPVVLILSALAVGDKVKPSFSLLMYLFFGIFYLGVGFMALGFLRHNLHLSVEGNKGMLFTFACVIGVWCSDTFAYLTGKFLGKTKLAPAISPNKTIEGLIGGMFFTVCFEVLFLSYFNALAPWYLALIYGALLALIATMGDLVESLWKRQYNLKDSGTALPGHGGIFDRVDAIILAAPFSFFFWFLINNLG